MVRITRIYQFGQLPYTQHVSQPELPTLLLYT